MKAPSHLFYILFLFPIISYSQQVNYRAQPITFYDYTSTFDIRFSTESSFSFYGKTDFYHSKKVKTVEVSSENGTVIWRLRLDTAGNMINTGYRGYNYFTEFEEIKKGENEFIRVTRYYEGEVLVRIDSLEYFTKKYLNQDTTLVVVFSNHKDYRIGYLINERNRYYNANYMGVPISDIGSSFYVTDLYTSESGEIKAQMNYYDKAYKTDYDSLKMYHCFSKTQIQNEYGLLMSAYLSIDLENLNHPFIREQNAATSYNYFTDGSDFWEPVFYRPQMLCSVDPYNFYPVDNGYRTGYHYDDKGLITEYYCDYFPEDTVATRIARLEREKQKEDQAESINGIPVSNILMRPDVPITVRSKTSNRLDTYFYRYEFFE